MDHFLYKPHAPATHSSLRKDRVHWRRYRYRYTAGTLPYSRLALFKLALDLQSALCLVCVLCALQIAKAISVALRFGLWFFFLMDRQLPPRGFR